MDIRAGIIVASILCVIAAYYAIRAAIKVMQTARKLSFYSLRRQHNMSAWRLFFLSLFLLGAAYWLPVYGEPIAFQYFPPSPTPSLTPTITPTPTITQPPSVTVPPSLTPTPLVSATPTITLTPFLPSAIEAMFPGPVTPNPDAVFTAIQFSTEVDEREAIDPRTVFEMPVYAMYGSFDYNNTIPGVQWTALWYRDGTLICFETTPWDGGTGGSKGLTECTDPIGGWGPGSYEVQIFMGYEWKVIGRFNILGELATSTPADSTLTPSFTPTP